MSASVPTIDAPANGAVAHAHGRRRRMERAFWVVSLIIALSYALFVYVNYRDSQATLHNTLASEGARQEAIFFLNLRKQGLHMQQFATYLAHQPQVRELFLAGRHAVEQEGGGAGGERAAAIRQRLFELVSPGWQQVTGNYQVRQLHFHLGPGDISFLRVHSPGEFGDDLAAIRHTITHAIRHNRPTHGFEAGRPYAGIRGVVPIAVEDPSSGQSEVVGALEAGSSFAQMLRLLEADTATSYSVLMDREHFLGTHWPEFARRLIAHRPLIDEWFIEAASDDVIVRRLMGDPAVRQTLGERSPVISRFGDAAYAVYSFPFRDFLRTVEPSMPPVGTVLAWHDASAELAAADASLRTNLTLGLLGFVVVETLLFLAWTLARGRLQRVIDGQLQALSESNATLHQEVALRMNSERKLKNYQVQLETLVSQRTRSLKDSVASLEQEVQQRRTVEQTLQRERDQVQVTLSSIIDGVITTDAACRVVYLNPAAEALTGWSSQEARGCDLNTVFPAQDMDRAGRALAFGACLSGACDRQHGENTRLVRQDGSEVYVEHSLSPIRDAAGVTIGLVLVFHDDTEARELAVQLSFHASHDALTGLSNRRAIELELADALRSSRGDHRQHAFLYIDLDQFKLVNDSCGHIAGDELLRQLSKLLQRHTRQSDCLARLGGDEFGLLLRNCGAGKVRDLAEALLKTLQGFHFVWQERTFRVGASIGVAMIDADAESFEAVMSAADAACYLAKEKGRNRVHMSLPDDGELRLRRGEMRWVSRIQQALADDRFVLFGQPIVPIASDSREAPHHEILVRMIDEQGELIEPAAFIPAAERYGVMPEVDRWIIDRTLRMIRQSGTLWPADAVSAYNINLSGGTMADEGILQFIRECFARHQIDPRLICFEVTETAAIANMSQAIDLMAALKQDGCRFALDDFGSGLSSFGYLKALPVDFIKIDGAFIRNLDSEPVNRVMVKAINDVGHAMSLKTIAEFVESEAIMQQLLLLGVDYAQGYGIGRPAELADAATDPDAAS